MFTPEIWFAAEVRMGKGLMFVAAPWALNDALGVAGLWIAAL